MQILIVSNFPSKRIDYFSKAGLSLGLSPRFITYNHLMETLPSLQNTVIKLEPPIYHESSFTEGFQLTKDYITCLHKLNSIPKHPNVEFINQPITIAACLDKWETKNKLKHLLCTPQLTNCVYNYPQLVTWLEQKKLAAVFIKPCLGSGAAGVIALRYHLKKKELIAYSSLALDKGIAYNTKKIHSYKNQEVEPLINMVLQEGAVIEEWIPKDKVQDEAYDLRVVCWKDKVDYIVVRRTKGVITNLHLNNRAFPYEDLGLSHKLQLEIEELCLTATNSLGLTYAGVDVLINENKAYIIEVNGQGDHLYQDIFAKNTIYSNQLERIRNGKI